MSFLRQIEYKYIVAAAFIIGLFTNLLDLTIINVALPTLQTEFGATTTEVQWIVTSYLLSYAIAIPVSGWAGDRFGTKRIFIFALLAFTLGSLLCGLAWNLESIVAFRLLQGVGGGLLTPIGTAMLFRAFPPAERAAAAAVMTAAVVIAPASGPLIGGYLVEYQSWRWAFLINPPLCAIAIVMALVYLREEKQEGTGRLDVAGFLLSAAGLGALIYALSQAGSRGFDDGRVLLFGVSGLVLLAVFVPVELRSAQPLIDLRLFGNRLFRNTNIVQFTSIGGLQGLLFLLPLLLQYERGLSPLQSGLILFPQAIGVTVAAQPMGRIYPRIGPRRLLVLGMTGAMLTTLAFLLVDLDTPRGWMMVLLFVRGLFFGTTLIALQAATFATISIRDMGQASALSNSFRQIGASFAVAVLASALANRLDAHNATLGDSATRDAALKAFHDAFIVAAAINAVGIVVALFVPDNEAAATMRGREVEPQAAGEPSGLSAGS